MNVPGENCVNGANGIYTSSGCGGRGEGGVLLMKIVLMVNACGGGEGEVSLV